MTRLLVIPAAFIALLAGAMLWSGGGIERRADFAFINRGDIYTLDLNQISYMQDFRMSYGIREGLYSPDAATMKPLPAGAVSHELSPDQRVWTFRLRPEARWSNGDPVTAHDYVFSYRRMLEEPGEYTYLFYYFTKARDYERTFAEGKPIDFKEVGVAALDDHTLRLTLDNPVGYMLELLAFPVFYPRHEKSMEPYKVELPNGRVTYGADYTRPYISEDKPGVVTNGPYVLKQWDFKRRLILERSETYWDRANVKTERIEMVVNSDPLGQFLLYETGKVDWIADVPGDLAAELKARGRTDLRTSPAFGTMFLTFLCRPNLPESLGGGKNPFADKRVRQAFAMATDKQFIVDHITRMGELPARTYLPPDGTLADFLYRPGPFDTTRPADKPYTVPELRALLASNPAGPAGPGLPYDVEAARKLLAEAGYPNGQGFPVVPILFNTDNTIRAKIAQSLKNQWKAALNVELSIEGVEGKIFSSERVSKKNYAIATVSWYGDYPDASTFTDKYRSDGLQNDSDWQNKAFDALCARAETEQGDVRRLTHSTAEDMIDTEVPILPLYHYVNVGLHRDHVSGVHPNPRNLTVFKNIDVKPQP